VISGIHAVLGLAAVGSIAAANSTAAVEAAVPLWMYAIGFTGQVLFTSRFVVQWIASERAGRSIIPLPFWLLSLGGSAILLIYAIYRLDPVFIVGQSFGCVVYIRNLMLLKKENDVKLSGNA